MQPRQLTVEPAVATPAATPGSTTPVLTRPTAVAAVRPATPPPAPARQTAPTTTVALAGPEQPWRDDPAARHVADQHRCITGWFELPTTMPDLPTVRCDWRMPVDAVGRPLPVAADLVAMFPYPTETSAIEGFSSPLTTRYGFTSLTIRFPKMRPEDGVPANDRKRWYYYPESGAGQAWITAIERVRQIGGLPPRQVFAMGRSGGGSAAHLFAEAHPELVAAVVQEAGRVHAEQLRHPGPMLLLHGHHDYVAEACIGLEGRLRRIGSDVTRVGFPPGWGSRGSNLIWSHSATSQTADLMWQWLAGVANLRLASGRIPPMAEWPVVQGGQRLPDEATRGMLQRITPDRYLVPLAGARVAIAKPAPSVAPRALAVVAINRFDTSLDQSDLDLIFLADHGVAALGASADGATVLPALQLALKRTDLAVTRDLPWILVVDQPDGLGGLLGLQPKLPQAVVLFNASAKAGQAAATLCASRAVPLVIAGTSGEVAKLRTAFASDAAAWTTLRDGNALLHHADRCKAMLAAIDKPKR